MAINRSNPLPIGFSFAFYTSILLILTFNSLPVSAIDLPSIAALRSLGGGDQLLRTNKNTKGPVFAYGKLQFKPYDFVLEGLFFAICFAYLFISFLGRARNHSVVSKWLKQSTAYLESEFAVIANGEGGDNAEKSLWNGGGEAVVYASGRRSVEG